jgi:hypothetical protein
VLAQLPFCSRWHLTLWGPALRPKVILAFASELRYCCQNVPRGVQMELTILTIVILVAASQIPGDLHVVFFR